ncbi:MAG: hypothetical protein F9K44_15305, partial [Hyphomicrobiaceae bacterium]
MPLPPTWALAVSDWVRYQSLRSSQPRLSLSGTSEPLPARVRRLKTAWAASRHADATRAAKFNEAIFEAAFHASSVKRTPVAAMHHALLDLGIELVIQNDNVFDFPSFDLSRSLTAQESRHVTERLSEVQTRLEHDARIHDIFSEGLYALYTTLLDQLPPAAYEEDSMPFSVPLYGLVDTAELIGLFLRAFLHDLVPAAPDPVAVLAFKGTRLKLWENLLQVSRLTPEQYEAAPHKVIAPKDCDLAPPAMIEAYLAGTPLQAFAETPLPFSLPRERRFEHCHIVAGIGHGKTQLMQTLMLADFDAADRPAVVAIDSQGDMIRTLSHLARFDPTLDDRLILLDPADTEWPLKLNLFDVNRARLDSLPRGMREQLLAGIIELYDYIFGALLGSELTAKQSVVFRFLAQLMLAIPDSNIHTLRQLLEDPTPFLPHLAKLPPTARLFLDQHLFAPKEREYAQTRKQVLRRLYDLLSNPTFERMFAHPKNALDMKRVLDQGRIVLVNTAKDVLKSEASATFGRFVIALILQAALERAADPVQQRRPAFVYVDEAADYFDDNIDTLLIQARKYKVGLTVAHQFLDQLAPALRASVMTNPSIRFAGGLSDKDARALASDMRTTPGLLLDAKKRAKTTEFACFVRNLTPSAVSLTVQLGRAEREPQMTPSAFAALLARVRSEVATPIAEVDAHIAAALSGGPMAHQEATSFGDE